MAESGGSHSIPFIKITRTRVKASSSSLLMGLGESSLRVNRCLSSEVSEMHRQSADHMAGFVLSVQACRRTLSLVKVKLGIIKLVFREHREVAV